METVFENADLFWWMAQFVDVQSALNLNQTSKLFRERCDTTFYQRVAHCVWGEDFWIRAAQRKSALSRPLASMRAELVRIERFQQGVQKLGVERFHREDFFKLWDNEARVRIDV